MIGRLLRDIEASCDWWELRSDGVPSRRFKFAAELTVDGKPIRCEAPTLDELVALATGHLGEA